MPTWFDRSRSLQELESHDWGEPRQPFPVVIKAHHLRRKPLNQFSTEDLRFMIAQSVGLPFLVPLAVEELENDPLAEANFYRGDLLGAVIRIGQPFWSTHADFYGRMCDVVLRVKKLLPSLDQVDEPTVRKVLEEASPAFLHQH
jgi:hypothetical protein